MQINLTTSLLATIWFLSASPAGAVAKPASLAAASSEIIARIEENDPMTQSEKDAWAKIKKALETAGQEAESEAGLKLSVTRILEHWNGKAYRVLDDGDAQHWALDKDDPIFPDSGAWFQARGTKWTVQYVGRYGKKNLFRRGDNVKTPGFHPVHSALQKKELDLELQGSPMSAARKVKAPIHPLHFSEYVLAETLAAGTLVTQNNKTICLQKSWLWLNKPVAEHLISRISFQAENCAAQLIDLRDSFGQDPSGALKISKKIPTVVLINGETREGAARLALRLKNEIDAHIIGETTGLSNQPESQLTLKALPWVLVTYAGYGKPVEPDAAVKDSLVYAEGLDTVYEQGLRWLGERLKK